MARLVPQGLDPLLRRALAEFEARRSIFELPRRSFWRDPEGVDLSVALPGGRVGSPVGPAAGPHTQLAQNIVAGWLAGGRVFELKTVQRDDRIVVPRPCIEVGDAGYNIEWSQELRIEESVAQYLIAWLLIHILHARGILEASGFATPLFDASVGYDLDGIRSAPMQRFLDALTDASAGLRGLRDGLPRALRDVADVDVPTGVVRSVTLSTFHGCPPEQIERIVEHLFARHRLHVVVKLNPTLLGHDEVESIIQHAPGGAGVVLDREAFEQDLKWTEAVDMLRRLRGTAERAGLTLGAKFTNTLVVRNTRPSLAGDVSYLSGALLHPIAVRLADRFARATGGTIGMSFSAGIDAANVAEAVACGFAPVTLVTDLLRPTGYRRLPRILKSLVAAMRNAGAASVPEFIARHADRAPAQGAPGASAGRRTDAARPATGATAALRNLSDYAARVADACGAAAQAAAASPERGAPLELFDCSSCNQCLVCCPNIAFFTLAVAPVTVDTWELTSEAGRLQRTPARFAVTRERQWALFADFCNACGNCTGFCPDAGRPDLAKPRFYGSRASFEADAEADGILIEAGGARIRARMDGTAYTLVRREDGALFSDGVIEVELDAGHRPIGTRAHPHAGSHRLSLTRYHALRLLCAAALAGIHPASIPGGEQDAERSTLRSRRSDP